MNRIAFLPLFLLAAVAYCDDHLPSYIVAHRGGVVSETLGENSLPALEAAIERGYTHAEVDLRVTSDGHAVCLHDRNLYELTDVKTNIDEVTLAELRELADVETIPDFETLCSRAAGRIFIMADIKDYPPALADAFAASLRDSLTRHGLEERLLFIGKDEIADRVGSIGRKSTRASADELRARLQNDPGYVERHFIFGHAKDFSPESIAEYHALGFEVVVSINVFHYRRVEALDRGKQDIHSVLDWGADGVQIDSVYDDAVFDKPPSR